MVYGSIMSWLRGNWRARTDDNSAGWRGNRPPGLRQGCVGGGRDVVTKTPVAGSGGAAVHFQSPQVKLDADGAEAHILRGGRETLSSPECRSVLVEIDEAHADEAVSLLESYGFRLDDRHKRKKSSPIWYGVFRRAAA